MKASTKYYFIIITSIVFYLLIPIWTSKNNGHKVTYLIRNTNTNEIIEAKYPVFVNPPNYMNMRFVENIYTVDSTQYFETSYDKSDFIVVGHLPYKATLSMFLPLLLFPFFIFIIVCICLSIKL